MDDFNEEMADTGKMTSSSSSSNSSGGGGGEMTAKRGRKSSKAAEASLTLTSLAGYQVLHDCTDPMSDILSYLTLTF